MNKLRENQNELEKEMTKIKLSKLATISNKQQQYIDGLKRKEQFLKEKFETMFSGAACTFLSDLMAKSAYALFVYMHIVPRPCSYIGVKKFGPDAHGRGKICLPIAWRRSI